MTRRKNNEAMNKGERKRRKRNETIKNERIFVFDGSNDDFDEHEGEMITHVKFEETVTDVPNNLGFTNLRRVDFHDNIQTIDPWAFEYCEFLEQVSLPKSLRKIESDAFKHSGLKAVIIPPRIKKIPQYCFSNCGKLESVVLPEGLEYIGFKAFEYCHKLETIRIPSSIKIGDPSDFLTHEASWFLGCSNLSLVNLPPTLEKIPAFTFRDCPKLEFINLKEGLKSIDRGAFMNSGLKGITLPSTLVDIGNMTGEIFENCKHLTSVTISEGLRFIPVKTFKSCYSLVSITLPESIETIGESAFAECRSLTSITIKSTKLRIINPSSLFVGCVNLRTVNAIPKILPIVLEAMDPTSSTKMCTVQFSD